jgi:hypothetical protein
MSPDDQTSTPTPMAASVAPPMRRWPRRLLGIALAAVLVVGVALWMVAGFGHGLLQAPIHVMVNDVDVLSETLLAQMNPVVQLLSVLALAAALLLAMVIVPMVLLLVMGGVALAVLAALSFSIGLPLLVVFGVLALLMSPLLLLGWLVWRLVRGRATPVASGASTLR